MCQIRYDCEDDCKYYTGPTQWVSDDCKTSNCSKILERRGKCLWCNSDIDRTLRLVPSQEERKAKALKESPKYRQKMDVLLLDPDDPRGRTYGDLIRHKREKRKEWRHEYLRVGYVFDKFDRATHASKHPPYGHNPPPLGCAMKNPPLKAGQQCFAQPANYGHFQQGQQVPAAFMAGPGLYQPAQQSFNIPTQQVPAAFMAGPGLYQPAQQSFDMSQHQGYPSSFMVAEGSPIRGSRSDYRRGHVELPASFGVTGSSKPKTIKFRAQESADEYSAEEYEEGAYSGDDTDEGPSDVLVRTRDRDRGDGSLPRRSEVRELRESKPKSRLNTHEAESYMPRAPDPPNRETARDRVPREWRETREKKHDSNRERSDGTTRKKKTKRESSRLGSDQYLIDSEESESEGDAMLVAQRQIEWRM